MNKKIICISIGIIMILLLTGLSIASAKEVNTKTNVNADKIKVLLFADSCSDNKELWVCLQDSVVTLQKKQDGDVIESYEFENNGKYGYDTDSDGIIDKIATLHILTGVTIEEDFTYNLIGECVDYTTAEKVLNSNDEELYIEATKALNYFYVLLSTYSNSNDDQEDYEYSRNAQITLEEKDGNSVIKTYELYYYEDAGYDTDSDGVIDIEGCLYYSSFDMIDRDISKTYLLTAIIDGYPQYQKSFTDTEGFPSIIELEKSKAKNSNNLQFFNNALARLYLQSPLLQQLLQRLQSLQ